MLQDPSSALSEHLVERHGLREQDVVLQVAVPGRGPHGAVPIRRKVSDNYHDCQGYKHDYYWASPPPASNRRSRARGSTDEVPTMSSIDRALSGDTLRFTLTEECAEARDPDLLARHGRNARTLVKEDGLRVTVVAVAAGGEIPEHQAEGPISVQVVEGSIRLRTPRDEHLMGVGALLTLPARVRHGVSSDGGGVFLLTVCHPVAAG